MGNCEETKSCKPEVTSSPPSSEQQQTGHVYPDWAAMQAYYGPRMAVPPYFNSAVTSGHGPPPYMWAPLQHMMPPYAAMYPHGGVYAHPGVTVAASPVHVDSPAKSSGNSDKGLIKKLKKFDGLAMSIGHDIGNSQSGETEGSSEGSDGNTTQGPKNGRKRSYGGSSTSSEVGKTEQIDQLPSINANGSSKKVTSGITPANLNIMPSMIQNERELKRERRKQSNRESARRSRLRKQAEAEDLGTRVESLTNENLTLKSEINRLSLNAANLKLQNVKLQEQLKKTQTEQDTEDPRKDKMRLSLSTANLLSKVDNASGGTDKNTDTDGGSGSDAKLRQLLGASPRAADAVAAG